MNDLPTRQEAEQEITDELIRVHEESYGAGAKEVETYVLDTAVLVILDLEITEAERTLLEAGKSDAVRRTREDFQEAVGAVFLAVVERATGRRVSSWVSRMSVDPVYSVELFRLEPS
jgi:uncharacterized protein YbcI